MSRSQLYQDYHSTTSMYRGQSKNPPFGQPCPGHSRWRWPAVTCPPTPVKPSSGWLWHSWKQACGDCYCSLSHSDLTKRNHSKTRQLEQQQVEHGAHTDSHIILKIRNMSMHFFFLGQIPVTLKTVQGQWNQYACAKLDRDDYQARFTVSLQQHHKKCKHCLKSVQGTHEVCSVKNVTAVTHQLARRVHSQVHWTEPF